MIMDVYSSRKRSLAISSLGSKNTKPESYVRAQLHKASFLFRLFSLSLPCKPDVILPKYKTVIFINGCFLH